MKITRVETFQVPPSWLFLRIETSDGLVGWGECGAQTFRGAIEQCVSQFAEDLIGQDPRSRHRLWETHRRSHFFRGGPILSAAMSGMDIALWDLHARSYGASVTDLLGGAVRDRLPPYVWLGTSDPYEDAGAVIVQADAFWRKGIRAFKLTLPVLPPIGFQPVLERFVDLAQAVRVHLGSAASLAVDFHGRANPRQSALAMDALRVCSMDYVEEPVAPDDLGALAHIIAKAPPGVAVAAGERAHETREALDLLKAGVLILNPDVAHSGCITEMQRYCALARGFGAAVAPHCAIGPIALAASAAIGFASTEVSVQEYPILSADPTSTTRYLRDPSPLQWDHDGQLTVLSGPGLGIEIDEDLVRESANAPASWRPARQVHPDGSVADW